MWSVTTVITTIANGAVLDRSTLVPCGGAPPFNTPGTKESVNGTPAKWSGSGEPRNAISPRNPMTRIGSRSRFSHSPASVAASVIEESQRCLGRPAGESANLVQRIWRREGLKVPAKHKPRGRLWLNDGSHP
jgi:hypothetical protein